MIPKVPVFYNQERKDDFMASFLSTKAGSQITLYQNACKQVFSSLCQFEVSFDKDFADFSPEECSQFNSSVILPLSSRRRFAFLNVLRGYVSYSMEQQFISTQTALQHPIFNMGYYYGSVSPTAVQEMDSEVMFVATRGVGSYDEFKKFCDLFFSHESMVMHRAAACLGWIGFSCDEIVHLKACELNEDQRTVCNVPIPDDFILDSLVKAKNAIGYHTFTDKSDRVQYRYYVQSGYLIKTVLQGRSSKNKAELDPEERPVQLPLSSVSRIKKAQDKVAAMNKDNDLFTSDPISRVRMNILDINSAGIFVRAYEKELQRGGTPLSRSEFIKLSQAKNNFRYGDYLNWKQVHHSQK